MTNIKKAKRAVTFDEFVIVVFLGVIAYMVVMKFFGDNLQSLVVQSNFQNINKPVVEEPAPVASVNVNDPNSQVNVQIVGEQGLTFYHNAAGKMIDNYTQRYTNGETLNAKDIKDFAAKLTVYGVSGEQGSNPVQVLETKCQSTCQTAMGIYGIYVNFDEYYTNINGNPVYWDLNNAGNEYAEDSTGNPDENKRVQNILKIYSIINN